MHKLIITDKLTKKLNKLLNKNPKIVRIIDKKTKEILKNPHRFKPLRDSMKNIRRVHIEKHFVLLFEIVEKDNAVKLLDFDHHDNIYY